ncbi:gluconate 2-dehydrogenase subunit 3 family protein [Micromonospora globispora]|uniref:gluconate 2-dehydrogenase subunit 3 family protein n=1 Tax=Micromonospora globispora TaxID=1450148 RepID=UPI00140227D9|nr:gluconate 2-dehydrogenase subunit 3 family protein [Micromonospora globispora]
MPDPLSDLQLATLRALCDTAVPAVDREDDPDGFWRRRSTDIGVDQALLVALDLMPAEQRAGLRQLLDVLADQGFADASQPSREQILTNLSLASREAAAGIGGLVAMTLFFAYCLPDETGRNPAWTTFGYPGPISPAPDVPKPITPLVPDGDTTLEADVVVVGSGAGGGLIAGRLATAGRKAPSPGRAARCRRPRTRPRPGRGGWRRPCASRRPETPGRAYLRRPAGTC